MRQIPSVKEIIGQWLLEHGYDGLYYEDQCGCVKEDLMLCDNPNPHCLPGYHNPGKSDGWVGPEKESDHAPDTE